MDISALINHCDRRRGMVPAGFHRYLYGAIDWNDRLIAIEGPRGCGKTTLLLQHINDTHDTGDRVLYVSFDDLWFERNDAMELIEYLATHGFTHLYVDEVHYLPTWRQVIKNAHDLYPELHVVYTGSSMLEIEQSRVDLSRRQMVYRLQGMSFGEYLRLEGIADAPTVTLDELLRSHRDIATELCGRVKVLQHFDDYLRHGYYPFYRDVASGYHARLREVVRLVIDQDYAKVAGVSQATLRKTLKMLMVLAARTPQTPVMSELYRQLETDRNQGLKMLNALETGGLLSVLSSQAKSLKTLAKPEKIYLNNPNLMYALQEQVDTGTLRETFFLNQLSQTHEVTLPLQGDFKVDGKYIFEVGGPNKKFTQIRDLPDSYLAIDNIETGYGNRIPLWMFGLLY